MIITERDNQIIDLLIGHEHQKIAGQLGFIKQKPSQITRELLYQAIGLIDRLSRLDDEISRRIAITLCAILWSYREKEWESLKDFLILVLSRIGFSPSAIMIDERYEQKKMRYSEMNSLFDQFIITCYHLNYEVIVDGKVFLLTEFQKNIWSKIKDGALLGISAPTSAGKSFILLLKCIDMLLRKPGDVVYIVPTLSLVFQVCVDFRQFFLKFGLQDYEILTSFYERPDTGKAVYVLTQEKAIAAFSQQEYPFSNLRFLIVDEIQNVERVAEEDEQRAKILYDTLIEFRHKCKPDITIISGPRIDAIGELGTKIFGVLSYEEQTKGSPVVNFTYTISKVGNLYYLKQYTDIRRRASSIPIAYSEAIEAHGGVQYRKKFHKYLSHIVRSLGPSSHNIIFSPTANQARRTAVALMGAVDEDF
ncbi:DEAD/DEAH box helicase, partial [bacterium]|nr:DEAD/DEAH box helicase [bacterium]